jgi:hypothetical protein
MNSLICGINATSGPLPLAVTDDGALVVQMAGSSESAGALTVQLDGATVVAGALPVSLGAGTLTVAVSGAPAAAGALPVSLGAGTLTVAVSGAPAAAGALPVSLAGGSIATTMAGDFVRGQITRPGNTTGYTDGDVWGTVTDSVILLEDVATAVGGSFLLDRITLVTSGATVAGKVFDLHFYNAAPVAIADNAAFDLDLSSDVPIYLGCISGISLEVANGSQACAAVTFDCNKQLFKCAAESADIFVRPVIRGALAPVSAEILKVIASVIR